MTKIVSIRQGNSLPFEFNRDGLSIEDWVCTINVKRFPNDTSLITRVIQPANGLAWIGFLTSTETEALPVSPSTPYYLIGILTNSTTDQEEVPVIRFNVVAPWKDVA